MSGEKVFLTQSQVDELVDKMCEGILHLLPSLHRCVQDPGGVIRVYGVPRGGIPVAMGLTGKVSRDFRIHMVDTPEEADIIVDDIFDSGATAERYKNWFPHIPFLCLVDKTQPEWQGKWVVMPWEVTAKGEDQSADDIVLRLLEYIGEDPHRQGLQDTPKRVLKGWQEWAQGYRQDPMKLLKTFTDGAENVNELVVVHNIPVISKCEHHLADIRGIAHVGYIPNGKIVGLSKIPRIVDLFARRLQVQERLTNQIADALQEGLQPTGVGVVIRAEHACMSTRGVKIQNSVTSTSAMRGALFEKGPARQEFFELCRAAENAR